MREALARIPVIDSHAAGDPPRIVAGGVPDTGSGSPDERREIPRKRFDWPRRAVILDPRGSESSSAA